MVIIHLARGQAWDHCWANVGEVGITVSQRLPRGPVLRRKKEGRNKKTDRQTDNWLCKAFTGQVNSQVMSWPFRTMIPVPGLLYGGVQVDLPPVPFPLSRRRPIRIMLDSRSTLLGRSKLWMTHISDRLGTRTIKKTWNCKLLCCFIVIGPGTFPIYGVSNYFNSTFFDNSV